MTPVFIVKMTRFKEHLKKGQTIEARYEISRCIFPETLPIYSILDLSKCP